MALPVKEKSYFFLLLLMICCTALACNSDDSSSDDSSSVSDDDDIADDDDDDDTADDDDDSSDDDDDSPYADVLDVEVSGDEGDCTFGVTLESPDTGCEQYADWWEVLSEGGELVYRRILTHSHPDEQPFTRTGGPVDAGKDAVLVLRGHMNASGYGGIVLKGTVEAGFAEAPELQEGFAPDVETQEPLPDDCLF